VGKPRKRFQKTGELRMKRIEGVILPPSVAEMSIDGAAPTHRRGGRDQ
jgi:hypothetical protein